ncbi:MAG: SDR family NAD(P)-dependent oxidoreductase [Candidatus Nanopelagicales bacterium]
MSGRVLVTGGSRGIGAAIARRFADDGWRVAVHFHASPDAAAEVLASLPGSGHVAVRADLRDPEAITRMVAEAAAALGGIDVLVNNAGVFFDHPIDEVDFDTWLDSWRQTLDINLLAPALVSWHAVRHMGPGGRIINVGSRGAFRGEPHSPAYGASKAGIAAFGQSLAKYLGARGIAVTTVAPGFVETDMATQALAGEAGAVRRAESPFGRVADPDEIAAAVAFLASPQAEWASGGILDLNGASYLRM